jgi:O-antigen/teichoic acid export membrane protein
LALLAPAGFFLCVSAFSGAILLGLGRSQDQFRLVVLNGCFLVVGTLLGTRGGAEGIAIGFSIGAALATPAYLFILARRLSASLRVIASDTLPTLVATLAMAVAVSELLRRLPHWNPVLELTVLVLGGAITFFAVLAAISGRQLQQDLRWILRPRRDASTETP